MPVSDTKTNLLDQAEALIRKHGHNAVSYQDLSAAIGIRKASIHYHFPAKADLLAKTMARYREEMKEKLDEIDDSTLSNNEKLRQWIALYRNASEDGKALCLCVAFSVSGETLNDAARDEIKMFRSMTMHWLTTHFKAAKDGSSILDVGDAKTEAAALLALVEGAQLSARFANDISFFDAAVALVQLRLDASNT